MEAGRGKRWGERLRRSAGVLGRFWPGRRARPSAQVFEGRVMGTYYALTLVRRPATLAPEQAHQAGRGELERIEALMSAYRPDSDVGRINASTPRVWTPISAETAALLEEALHIGRLSQGAYDVAAGALVNLWGFGPDRALPEPPPTAWIEQARGQVGPGALEVRLTPPAARRRSEQVRVDLASIAKGYAVDRAAEALAALEIVDYCVDVGGEFRVRGRNPTGAWWQIAVEVPEPASQGIQRIIALKDRAIATSGDYRIFAEAGGSRFSHIIDPRTGRPVDHAVASVSVMEARCARADAWATALMVAGPEAGYDLAVRERLAALFLLRTPEGIQEKVTPRFLELAGA